MKGSSKMNSEGKECLWEKLLPFHKTNVFQLERPYSLQLEHYGMERQGKR